MPRASTSSDLAPPASRSHDDPEDLDDPEANPLEDIESEAAHLRTTTTTTGTTGTRRRNRQERQEESELTRLTGAIADTRNMLERFVQTQRTMFRANNDMRENFINYTNGILRNVNNENFAWMRYYIEEGVRFINRQPSQPSQQAPQPPQQPQFPQATDGTLEEPRPGPSSQQPQDPFFAPPNRTVSPAYSISEFMNLSVSSANLSGNLSQFQYTPLQTPLQTPSRTSPTPPMLERVSAPELAAQ